MKKSYLLIAALLVVGVAIFYPRVDYSKVETGCQLSLKMPSEFTYEKYPFAAMPGITAYFSEDDSNATFYCLETTLDNYLKGQPFLSSIRARVIDEAERDIISVDVKIATYPVRHVLITSREFDGLGNIWRFEFRFYPLGSHVAWLMTSAHDDHYPTTAVRTIIKSVELDGHVPVNWNIEWR